MECRIGFDDVVYTQMLQGYRWGGGLSEGEEGLGESGFAGGGGAGYEDVGEGAGG